VARIRTVKPGFFRHEGLQELESLHPGAHTMLVFAGLFTAVRPCRSFRVATLSS
jgi:hypothetical protein